jgi:L-asparaginase
MGGAILPAVDAVKTDTDRYDTFQAPNLGPLGDIRGGVVRVSRHRTRRALLPTIPDHAAEPVYLLTATVAADAGSFRGAMSAGARGIVMAATGSGNTAPALLEAAREAMARGIPVVHATRCLSGRVSPSYGFPGGGAEWQRAGAISAGSLGAPKARVALALGLGADLDDAALRQLFAAAGG